MVHLAIVNCTAVAVVEPGGRLSWPASSAAAGGLTICGAVRKINRLCRHWKLKAAKYESLRTATGWILSHPDMSNQLMPFHLFVGPIQFLARGHGRSDYADPTDDIIGRAFDPLVTRRRIRGQRDQGRLKLPAAISGSEEANRAGEVPRGWAVCEHELERALKGKLSEVRRQRREMIEFRTGKMELVRRYVTTATTAITTGAKEGSRWNDSDAEIADTAAAEDVASKEIGDRGGLSNFIIRSRRSGPRTWSELRESGVLHECEFDVSYVKPIARHPFAMTEGIATENDLLRNDTGGAHPMLDWRQGYVADNSSHPSLGRVATRRHLISHTDDSEVTLN